MVQEVLAKHICILLYYLMTKENEMLPSIYNNCIAAILMKGGKSIHSELKLPVPLLDTLLSSMKDAEDLRQEKLIIVDEAIMLTKDSLSCIDLLFRKKILKTVSLSGIGGDFKQTLPLVLKGTRTEILENCI